MTGNRLSNALLPVPNKKPRDASELGNVVRHQSHSIGASDGGNLAMPQRIDRQSNPCRPDSQAPVSYEIPREVVAEGIVNAVAHRDYSSNGSVQVMLFADRLEVWNPGRLPGSLTIARLRESWS